VTGSSPAGPNVLPLVKHGRACLQRVEIIKGQLARDIQELLVRWEGQTIADAVILVFIKSY
jgi:hypothetical protein